MYRRQFLESRSRGRGQVQHQISRRTDEYDCQRRCWWWWRWWWPDSICFSLSQILLCIRRWGWRWWTSACLAVSLLVHQLRKRREILSFLLLFHVLDFPPLFPPPSPLFLTLLESASTKSHPCGQKKRRRIICFTASCTERNSWTLKTAKGKEEYKNIFVQKTGLPFHVPLVSLLLLFCLSWLLWCLLENLSSFLPHDVVVLTLDCLFLQMDMKLGTERKDTLASSLTFSFISLSCWRWLSFLLQKRRTERERLFSCLFELKHKDLLFLEWHTEKRKAFIPRKRSSLYSILSYYSLQFFSFISFMFLLQNCWQPCFFVFYKKY